MAIIGKEKYNQEKIDKLHDYLKMYQDMGQPIDFEVLVDGFKAVRRTANPEMFRLFENFVNGETKSIEVLFYQGSSNNNDKHLFTFVDEEKSSSCPFAFCLAICSHSNVTSCEETARVLRALSVFGGCSSPCQTD